MNVFATYMVFIVGGGLMLFPHRLLGIFQLSAGDDVWVRMTGLLAFILGVFVALTYVPMYFFFRMTKKYAAHSFDEN